MPLIPSTYTNSVAFVTYINCNGQLSLAGTCFFVTPDRDLCIEQGKPPLITYAVTARHVVASIEKHSVDGDVILRVNSFNRNDPPQKLSTRASDWIFHPDDASVDVAIFQLPLWNFQDERQANEDMEINSFPFPEAKAISAAEATHQGIGPGSETFMFGLFAYHSGRQRNLPIVRVGNIAAMPEPGEGIPTEYFGEVEAYLIEARSLGGISGSPVFAKGQKEWVFLGLVHGHWMLDGASAVDMAVSRDSSPAPMSERQQSEVLPTNSERNEFLQRRKDEQFLLNTGIAIVVPASKVGEVLYQPKVVEQRQKVWNETSELMRNQPETTREHFLRTLIHLEDSGRFTREQIESFLKLRVGSAQAEVVLQSLRAVGHSPKSGRAK